MRVGLNATCFNDRPSGARQRFVGIYGALIRGHPEIEFVIYEPRDCRVAGWFANAPNVEPRQTPLPSTGRLKRALAGMCFWRSQLRTDRLDLFEVFSLPIVNAPDCPTLLTVHDMRQIEPHASPLMRLPARLVWHRAFALADHVITVSGTMADHIRSFRPRTPVTTIYNGLDSAPFNVVGEAEATAAKKRFNLPDNFILAVGHLEPRKNYERLIAALSRLRHTAPEVGLVIVGNDGGSGAAIAAQIQRYSLSDRVRLLSGVGDDDLRSLYLACRLFVFPSTYEGFGIPILEAMAARRPFAVSDLPVFREITEGHGFYFDPLDVESIANTLLQAQNDMSLQHELARYSETRVKDFQFHLLAEQVYRLYMDLAAEADS